MKNATSILTSVMGAVAAFAGIEHGIGEILQGNTAPGSMWILSWPDSAFFKSVGGEPAMTILPNLLITGIIAIIVSVAFLLCSVVFVQRKNAGIVLIGLSVAMLLFGGGIFPPVLGIMVGLLGTRVHRPIAWCPTDLQALVGKLWPYSLTACLIAWLLLFPGSSVLDYFFGISIINLLYALILAAFVLFLVTISFGFVLDSKNTTGV